MSLTRHTLSGLDTAAKSRKQHTLQPVLRLRHFCAGITFEGRVGFVMEETWKPVVGYEGYYDVSNLGRVRALFYANGGQFKPGRILKPSLSKDGYVLVHLKAKTTAVHVIVLEAFVGRRPKGNVSRHLDGKRNRNIWTNLAWGTQAQNLEDARKHGTLLIGERNPRSKLTARDVMKIRALHNAGYALRTLSKMFKTALSNVSFIVNRKRWTHV